MKRKLTEADILMWQQLTEFLASRAWYKQAKEWQFFESRKWRFDFAILPKFTDGNKIAIEIEGGAWKYGHHNRGQGFIDDMEKYNHAALLGWCVLRFTPAQVLDGTAIAFIRKVLES